MKLLVYKGINNYFKLFPALIVLLRSHMRVLSKPCTLVMDSAMHWMSCMRHPLQTSLEYHASDYFR